MNNAPEDLVKLMQALRGFLRTNDMMAYLTMMALRLVELHRVLKPTGSIFHLDTCPSSLLIDYRVSLRHGFLKRSRLAQVRVGLSSMRVAIRM